MKAKWWTCGCGKKQVHRGLGTPVCEACGKRATFTVEPPRGQGGFDFEAVCEYCGDHCYHGAEHNERVTNNDRYDD